MACQLQQFQYNLLLQQNHITRISNNPNTAARSTGTNQTPRPLPQTKQVIPSHLHHRISLTDNAPWAHNRQYQKILEHQLKNRIECRKFLTSIILIFPLEIIIAPHRQKQPWWLLSTNSNILANCIRKLKLKAVNKRNYSITRITNYMYGSKWWTL